jgi:microcompartment protein CcmK/EutM
MQVAIVVGHAVSTVKHVSLTGWRLLIVQPLGAGDKLDGEPLLAVDSQGAGAGARVLISNDGKGARALVGAKTSPVRWFVMGLIDES